MGIFKSIRSILSEVDATANKVMNTSYSKNPLLDDKQSLLKNSFNDVPRYLEVKIDMLYYDSNGVVFLVRARSSNDFMVYDDYTGSYYSVVRNYDYIPVHILLTILHSNIAKVTILGNVSKLENGCIVPSIDYNGNSKVICEIGRKHYGEFYIITDEYYPKIHFSDVIAKLGKHPIENMVAGVDRFCYTLSLDKNKLGIIVPTSYVTSKRHKFSKMSEDQKKETTVDYLIVDNQGVCLGLCYNHRFIESIPGILMDISRGVNYYIGDNVLVPDPENKDWKVLVKGVNGGLSSINDKLPKYNIVSTDKMLLHAKQSLVLHFERYSSKKVSSTIKRELGML